MAAVFSGHCVYTIVHRELLEAAQRAGGPATFEESKVWVTGHELWQEARDAGSCMPVLLGDAVDCSALLCWGLLTDVNVAGDRTRFTADRVRAFREPHTPQELVLRSTGEHIAAGFIRPYAICKTPDFLQAIVEQTT